MRHAFLILAHSNYWQLKQLFSLLDSENHDLYIHIDKRSKDFNIELFSDMPLKANIFIFQRYKVYWGDFSIVEAELFLLGKAYENHYDYYHIISGSDLPLKSNNEMDIFFERNKGYEFIDLQAQKSDYEIHRRIQFFYLLRKYRKISNNNAINVIFVTLSRCSLALQIALHIDRAKKLDWTVKYGSQWCSITDGFVKEVLKNRDKIKSMFKFTNCSDELFIQTVAYNSKYRDNIYHSSFDEVYDNMRLIDWKRRNTNSPYTFRDEDYDELIHSEALIARKFSEDVDKDIIKKIVSYVGNKATI